jgi:hypothetical protein
MPAFASPKSLLQHARSALTVKRPPQPPKPDGLARFTTLSEAFRILKAGTLQWKASPKERHALFVHAANCSVPDNVAFAMCGVYFLHNPRNHDLAKGIRKVFLDSNVNVKGAKASAYGLNLDRPTYQELDRMLDWRGFGDVAGTLEKAATGLMVGMHESFGDTMKQLKARSSNTAMGPGILRDLAGRL